MTAGRTEFDGRTPSDPANEVLARAYRLIADCFVYPEELDRHQFVEEAMDEVVPAIAIHVDEDVAAHLSAFLDAFETVGSREYVQTLELSPSCPLYLGHYAFDDPQTCREIADADRNQYMVELAAIYEHFGFELDNELPDFVPAMVEFLWLTRSERDDALRAEYLSNLSSMLPGMIERFEEHGTPYRWPLEALQGIIRYDLETGGGGDR